MILQDTSEQEKTALMLMPVDGYETILWEGLHSPCPDSPLQFYTAVNRLSSDDEDDDEDDIDDEDGFDEEDDDFSDDEDDFEDNDFEDEDYEEEDEDDYEYEEDADYDEFDE
jgi:hypothetical protein